SWQGAYGSDGYRLAQGATALPPYATLGLSGQANYTWAAATSDPRALQQPGLADRLAGCWYANAFTATLTLTGGQPHRVALYLLDWDNQGRVEAVDVLDSNTGQVLSSQQVSSFSGGTYLVWDITGQVTFRFTKQAGPNAVLSAFFFS